MNQGGLDQEVTCTLDDVKWAVPLSWEEVKEMAPKDRGIRQKRLPFHLRICIPEQKESKASTSQKKKCKSQRKSSSSNQCSKNSKANHWRDKLKDTNPIKYGELKELEKTRSQLYRLNIALAEKTLTNRNLSEEEREEAEKWLARKKHYNEQSKIRQRKYLAKKKEKKKDQPTCSRQKKDKPTCSRQKADKKREYEKSKKKNQRARLSEEERQAILTRRRELYAEKKMEKKRSKIHGAQDEHLRKEEQRLKEIEERLKAIEDELQRKHEEMALKAKELEERNKVPAGHSPSKEVDTARRQSLHRDKSCMPETVSHFVETVADIVNEVSPHSTKGMSQAGITVKKSKRRLTLDEAITEEVGKGSRGKSTKKRKVLGSTLALMKKYKLQREAYKRFSINKKLLRDNKQTQDVFEEHAYSRCDTDSSDEEDDSKEDFSKDEDSGGQDNGGEEDSGAQDDSESQENIGQDGGPGNSEEKDCNQQETVQKLQHGDYVAVRFQCQHCHLFSNVLNAGHK